MLNHSHVKKRCSFIAKDVRSSLIATLEYFFLSADHSEEFSGSDKKVFD